MTTITLQVPKAKTAAVLETIKGLGYARKVKVEEDGPTKAKIIEGIKEAVEEMKLIKAGKLKGIPAKDLLHEL